jgi:folate-binding protein YgfZ
LLAQTLKRLSMFVLRAKAKLSDATAEFTLLGLSGDVVQHMCGPHASTAPWLRHVVNEGPDSADVLTIYPSQGVTRALYLASSGSAATSDLAAFAQLPGDVWSVADVMAGVAWVEQATFEAFVPQMLNYESVDGVNFKKGCYPGQEVVARSQFRGTLKRRAFIVQADVPMLAGQEVFSSADPTQPCGLVAQAASDGDHHVAIVELQLSATQGHSLHLGTAQGALLHLLPLPYPLRDDI